MRFVFLIAGALMLVLAFLFYILWIVFKPLPPLPVLAQNIPIEFERRVRSAFPLGSSEKKMLEELEAEGFRRSGPDWSNKNGPPLNIMFFYRNESLFCKKRWTVSWKSSHGLLTKVEANYIPICL